MASSTWFRARISRRTLGEMALAAASFWIGKVWGGRAVVAPPSSSTFQETLDALLDVLLPDGEFPGHRATGVRQGLMARFGISLQTGRLFPPLFEHLDSLARQQGASSFARLDDHGRHRVMLLVQEERSPGYTVLRDEVMRLHYTHPDTWQRLRFPHPPQPDGFRDFTQPPDARS